MRGKSLPVKVIFMLCTASFLAGSLFTRHTWPYSSINNDFRFTNREQKLSLTTVPDCDRKRKLVEENSVDVMAEVTKTHQAIQSLDKTISTLEMELEAARTSLTGAKFLPERVASNKTSLQKAFVVIGINTAFSSKKRRDSVRETWMPIASFLAGSLFTRHTWPYSSINNDFRFTNREQKLSLTTVPDCDRKRKLVEENSVDVMAEVTKTHQAIQSLDKTISTLEMELEAARTSLTGAKFLPERVASNKTSLQKAFVVIGINTAFSSKKRRDSVRETWMPTGSKLNKLAKEKGIIVRFVIGHSATPGGVLDQAIDAEDEKYHDFLRLNHVEGYHELSMKTRLYFSTAVSIWDAEFYVKVDDDVHVNLGMLATSLARVRYHEPEYWKFGEEGNKYFRHATGQIYAISKDLAAYISINSGILHRYANEDVSLGSWLIGLDVQHIDDRSMCCGTPPDCEWKTQSGNVCVASFDWSCSGICKSVDRMKFVHNSCGEGDSAVWNVDL
ncbi:galactosyltransferase family protein [Artemisia annua]|uniref:Hexosyltransferase n=1 Tax=Artemisia annua TaxID=35608 RepID=A0A2U1PWL9_ARTAN|nr:galactosyltransferase family protein [Artemisia annua]